MNQRFCPCCNTFKDEDQFKRFSTGVLAKVCVPCNKIRRANAVRPLPASTFRRTAPPPIGHSREFPGVDIDRIHRVRGATRKS